MFGKSFTLGKIFGITIRVDYSWFIVFALISVSLARGYFPGNYQFDLTTNIFLGVVTAILFFVSVLIHELTHSLVGNRYGARIKRITLFIFGGAAELEKEPPSPSMEFKMAIVGPLSSLAIGFLCYLLLDQSKSLSLPTALQAIFDALGFFNISVAIFNLLPGYPLDGGRLLRAVIWHFKKDLVASTEIAVTGGKILANLLIFGGLFLFIIGDSLSGLWLAMIGIFLNFAAEASMSQTRLQQLFSKVKVKALMTKGAVDLENDLKMSIVYDFYLLKNKLSGYPVLKRGNLIGMLYLEKLAGIGPIKRDVEVENYMTKLTKKQIVSPDDSVLKAQLIMVKNHLPSLPVYNGKILTGIISQSDINHYLFFKAISFK